MFTLLVSTFCFFARLTNVSFIGAASAISSFTDAAAADEASMGLAHGTTVPDDDSVGTARVHGKDAIMGAAMDAAAEDGRIQGGMVEMVGPGVSFSAIGFSLWNPSM